MQANSEEKSKLLKLRLQPKTLERIERIGEITKTGNRAQLVASSIKLTDELLAILQGGSKIYIEKPDGTKELVKVFGF